MDSFFERIEHAGFDVSPEQRDQFNRYYALLLEWNQRINLVSRRDVDRIVGRHFPESIAVLAAYGFPFGATVVDLGTGAGLPGIPIKIMRPDLQVLYLDSKNKKMSFIQDVVKELDLKQVQVVCGRIEEWQRKQELAFDCVVCRAVADLSKLWRWSRPILKNAGSLVAMKGGELDEEISALLKKYANISVVRREYPVELVPEEEKKCLLEVRLN